MIYKMILKVNANCLLMTHPFFLYFMTLILQQMILIMISVKPVNELFNGKGSLTRIPLNRLKK